MAFIFFIGITDVMERDPRKQTHGLLAAGRVAGVPRATLNSWINRGHFTVESLGHRQERQLTFSQVVIVAALADLALQGIDIAHAANLLRSVEPDISEVVYQRHGGPHRFLGIVNSKAYVGTMKNIEQKLALISNAPRDPQRPVRFYGVMDLSGSPTMLQKPWPIWIASATRLRSFAATPLGIAVITYRASLPPTRTPGSP